MCCFNSERYVASALEPPAVSVYPAGGAGGASGGGGAAGRAPHNPWQREERERLHEARRAAARARRYRWTQYPLHSTTILKFQSIIRYCLKYIVSRLVSSLARGS